MKTKAPKRQSELRELLDMMSESFRAVLAVGALRQIEANEYVYECIALFKPHKWVCNDMQAAENMLPLFDCINLGGSYGIRVKVGDKLGIRWLMPASAPKKVNQSKVTHE